MENCVENVDNFDENMMIGSPSSKPADLKVERNLSRNLSKVVPIDSDLEFQEIDED